MPHVQQNFRQKGRFKKAFKTSSQREKVQQNQATKARKESYGTEKDPLP